MIVDFPCPGSDLTGFIITFASQTTVKTFVGTMIHVDHGFQETCRVFSM
jgi:hypothetical protein